MSTLTQLVNETTNIKNELVNCHGKLKTKISKLGITTQPNDKLSGLIDKIDGMTSIVEEKAASFRLFSTSHITNKIYELDPDILLPIRIINSASTSYTYVDGGFDGTKLRLFKSDYSQKKLYELDIDTLKPIKTVQPTGTPAGIGGGFDGTKLRLFHAEMSSKRLHELDPNTLQPIKTVTYNSSVLTGMGGGFDGKKLRLFLCEDASTNKIHELDPNTLQSIKTVNCTTGCPYGIGGGFDGKKLRLFVANDNTSSTTLQELNPDTLQPINSYQADDRMYYYGIGGGHSMEYAKFVTQNDVKYKLVEV